MRLNPSPLPPGCPHLYPFFDESAIFVFVTGSTNCCLCKVAQSGVVFPLSVKRLPLAELRRILRTLNIQGCAACSNTSMRLASYTTALLWCSVCICPHNGWEMARITDWMGDLVYNQDYSV
jgi:hypothetical protein